MSGTGSVASGHTDSFTNGLNPMYQSLSVTTQQDQSEYDVIGNSQSCLINSPISSKVTTFNTIYSSNSEASTIKHPTLNSSPEELFRFAPIPEISHFEEERKEPRCLCSYSAILYVVTLFNILLSAAAIALCLLLWFNVISNFHVTSTSSTSSSMSTDPPSINTSMCNCTALTPNLSSIISFSALTDVRQNLTNISEEIRNLQTLELNNLFSRVNSLSDSIQQLRIEVTNTCSVLSQERAITEPVELDELGNQTCPPNVTKLNQPADVTYDISDQCTLVNGAVCNVNPNSFCLTSVLGFVNMNDQVLVDFFCYAEFQDGTSGVPNATAAIREDTITNTTRNQDISSIVLSTTQQTLGCQCLSFEDTATLSCRYFAKYCNFKEETVESEINILS